MSLIKGLISGTWKSGRAGKDFIERPLRVDASTHSIQTITYEHHEIHAGSMYRVQHNQSNIPATASSGDLVIVFYVPDVSGKQPHMLWESSHEGPMTITCYEGVTVTAGNGTDVAPKNSNRTSSNTSFLQGTGTGSLVSGYVTVGENSADSIYTGGTAISTMKDYASKQASGGQDRSHEIVLKNDTYYAISLKNNDTSAAGGQIRLEWYEHTYKG